MNTQRQTGKTKQKTSCNNRAVNQSPTIQNPTFD